MKFYKVTKISYSNVIYVKYIQHIFWCYQIRKLPCMDYIDSSLCWFPWFSLWFVFCGAFCGLAEENDYFLGKLFLFCRSPPLQNNYFFLILLAHNFEFIYFLWVLPPIRIYFTNQISKFLIPRKTVLQCIFSFYLSKIIIFTSWNVQYPLNLKLDMNFTLLEHRWTPANDKG